MPSLCLSQRPARCAWLVAMSLVSGCGTSVALTGTLPDVVTAEVAAPTHDYIPVVRQGRYTLVELAPAAAQRDLLQQVVDVSLPTDAHASVGDALRHVLKRSGYRLCESSAATRELYSLPLPLAHHRLGPMTARDALLTLAGPAWAMRVDDRLRQICFDRADPAPGIAEASDTPGHAHLANGDVQVFAAPEGASP
ncbi:TPA: PilL N-terminal domain-containing protein [Pseudomonas aeruginosa]|nr:PilL N-terminal domain-containing protein [Pseudomonas aeruginosa]HBO3291867.1 PilL N-terminal domain-containing protein [Pseudomonas aeruginosa]